MRDLKEKFMEFCFYQGKLTGKEANQFFDWISENCVSREKVEKLKDLFPTNITYTKEMKNLVNKILRGINKLLKIK